MSRALKAGGDGAGQVGARQVVHALHRVPQRHPRLEVEREGDSGELAQVIYRERPQGCCQAGDHIEWYELAAVRTDVEERES